MATDGQKMTASLLAVFLLSRLLPALLMPLVLDESLYAVMIEEQASEQKLLPTFLGHPVSWKPFLFFSVYSVSAFLDFLSPELAYRLPSLVFGLATIPLLFGIFRNCKISDSISFVSMLIYLCCLPSIYPNAAVLTDTLAFFLICLSLWLYTLNAAKSRYIPAAAAAFAAFFVKLVLAYIIPVLAVCYFLQYRKKEIDAWFILSLLSVPLAMGLHYLLLDSAGLSSELYFWDVGGHFVSAYGLSGQVGMLLQSAATAVSSGMVLWLGISFISFARTWRDNLFLSAWYALSLIPAIVSTSIFWYFLPVLPAISYFAAQSLAGFGGRERTDRFFWICLSLLLIASLAISAYSYAELYANHEPEREAGHLLSDKDGVLIVGKYRPGIVAYKMIDEERSGTPRDFGWVVISSSVTANQAMAYADDYYSDRYPVTQGSFSSFFTRDSVFRKDTNLTGFEYVAIAGPHQDAPDGSVAIFNKSEINIYQVK